MPRWSICLYLVVLTTLGSALAACGPDRELVANGVVHQCELQRLEAAVAADPANAALQAELSDRAALLVAVIESAPDGQRAALSERITELVAEGACH